MFSKALITQLWESMSHEDRTFAFFLSLCCLVHNAIILKNLEFKKRFALPDLFSITL